MAYPVFFIGDSVYCVHRDSHDTIYNQGIIKAKFFSNRIGAIVYTVESDNCFCCAFETVTAKNLELRT